MHPVVLIWCCDNRVCPFERSSVLYHYVLGCFGRAFPCLRLGIPFHCSVLVLGKRSDSALVYAQAGGHRIKDGEDEFDRFGGSARRAGIRVF